MATKKIQLYDLNKENTLYPKITVEQLDNTTISSATNGQVLKYNGTNWVNSAEQDISGKQDKSTAVTHTASTATGSATQPVYVNSSGVATATTYSLNKTVPSNAVFTDTVTTASTTGSGNAVTSVTASNGALTVTKGTTFLTSHQDISGKADKATTLAGYGITDAKIASGVITLGSNTITPLTSHQSVTNSAPTLSWGSTSTVGTVGSTSLTVKMPSNPNTDTKVTQTVSTDNYNYPILVKNSNATTTVTDTAKFASAITVNPSTGNLAVTQINGVTVGSSPKFTDTVYTHPSSGVTAGTYRSVTVNAQGHVTAGSNPTTLSGYGITDAKIASGVITLGSNTITPLTSHQDISGKVDVSYNYAGSGRGYKFIKNNNTLSLNHSLVQTGGWDNAIYNVKTGSTSGEDNLTTKASIGEYGEDTTLNYLYIAGTGKTYSNALLKIYPETGNITINGNSVLTSHQSLANYSTLANTVKSLSISGKTITVTPGSGDAYTLTTQDTTYTAGTGLTLSGTQFKHSNSVTAATAGTSSATSGSTLAVPYVTYDAQGHVTASGTHTHTITGFLTSHQSLTAYAKLASPALTGTPTAPTASVGTNTTQIATTAYVKAEINSVLEAADAMIFKGTLGTGGTVTALPTSGYKVGWTYRVITAGTYAGNVCEVGDMIVAIKDYASAFANSDWTVIQNNLDGAVIGPSSSVDGRIATYSGTTGKVIKDSGYTIATSVPSGAKFTDTTYSAGTGLSLSGTTFSLGTVGTAGNTGNSTATSGSTLSVPYVTVDAYGRVTGYGNRTHTVSGFLTSSSTLDATKLSGTASISTTGNAATATTATKVGSSLTLKIKSGSTEGTDLYTFNGSASKTLDIKAGSNVSLTAGSGTLTIAATDTVYTHPSSGVTAGTYKSVTVNAQGHVTAGSNPTTLSGYGITDAKIASGVITLGSNTITPLTSHQSVTNSAPTLSWGATSTIGKVGSTSLTVTMPSNPNTNYYPTAFAWSNGTSSGPTGSLTGTGMSAVSFGAIPSASASYSGVVTTGTQTFAGNKTFNGSITVGGACTISYNSTTESLDFTF